MTPVSGGRHLLTTLHTRLTYRKNREDSLPELVRYACLTTWSVQKRAGRAWKDDSLPGHRDATQEVPWGDASAKAVSLTLATCTLAPIHSYACSYPHVHIYA